MRQPLNEMQHNQRPTVDTFARSGLSSHLKTGVGPGATATAFVPTVRPRGMRCSLGSAPLELS